MLHRRSLAAVSLAGAVALAVACAATGSRFEGAATGGGGAGGGFLGGGDCNGLQCQALIDDCAARGKPPTTLHGTVYDPAGRLPLYNVYVYIPNATPYPIAPGSPTCTQCAAPASGSPILGASTDARGHFTLSQGPGDKWGVPSGADVPLVIQVGKWRRQIVVPHIEACAANALPDPKAPADKLRLPARSSEGDMPLIAFTSGCDPAECFLRHVGIDDSEFVPPGSPTGHVHFYTGQDDTNPNGGQASQVPGGNTATDTYAWWAHAENLQKYDIVFNACECGDFDRGPTAYQAMHDYLDAGGRVFASHYFYNWFAPPTGPTDFQSVVSWNVPETLTSLPYQRFFIDSSFPKGKAFADWLQAQQVTSTYGQITLADARYDVNAVNPQATRWIYAADAAGASQYATMYMSVNTPVAQPAAMQCGRAVYSDVHLSGISDDTTFPTECTDPDYTGSHAINERALEFLFFDLSSCVQDNSTEPPPPPQK